MNFLFFMFIMLKVVFVIKLMKRILVEMIVKYASFLVFELF